MAGAAVPVKFGLGGDQGLAVFAAGYPTSETIACASSASSIPSRRRPPPGPRASRTTLTGQYRYTWKTDKAWANTCRKLVIRLADGTEHTALFKFTK